MSLVTFTTTMTTGEMVGRGGGGRGGVKIQCMSVRLLIQSSL